jgi:hypothetical protein
MEEKQATGAEVGLTGDEQIKIALQTIIKHGGKATIEEIYHDVEAEMNGFVLSDQGKASLRSSINRTAVEKKYVYPHDDYAPGWRITPLGRQYVEDSLISDDVEEEEVISDAADEIAIKEPYNPTQIRVDLTPFTVFQIMRKIKLEEIDLQPDFQRHIVWDETRQSRLIESILIRIPLPAFYLDAVDDDRWLVVDGLQRLSTLDKFFNKNELKLKNVEFLTDLEGSTFKNLPRKFQRQIEDTKLQIYLIQPDTPPRVKFTIFYRINTGGLFLTAQEIRHALFQGKATKLLSRLAEQPEFKRATTNSISSKRMDDRECILRFLAFYLSPYTSYDKADLHGFLSDTMQNLNQRDEVELTKLRDLFIETMCKAEAVFGEYAFRKMYEIGGRRYPINKSLFEVWSVGLTKYHRQALIACKDEIVKQFIEIMNTDSDFSRAISQGTGSITNVKKRFSTVESLLAKVIS